MILYKKYVKAYRIIDNMYYDMRVRSTLEITTYIRKSGYRPFCSCLFAHLIDISLRLQAALRYIY